MLNRVLPYVLGALLAVQPALARAADLNSAFDSLLSSQATSINAPGQYSSQARNSFVAGGVDIRFPRQNVNLVSITPPSFNAGCGGITAHFGGFSFISGAQIEAQVKQIAAGTVGFVVGMAIKALCPQCSAVIEAMQALAQKAASMNMDSCKIAQNLANLAMSGLGVASPNNATAKGQCAGRKITSGASADFMDALTTACDTVTSIVDTAQQYLDSADTPDKKAAARAELAARGMYGNQTWNILKVAYFGGNDPEAVRARTLFMSMLGTTVYNNRSTASAEDGNGSDYFYPGLTPADTLSLLMCGQDGAQSSNQLVKTYCKPFATNNNSAQPTILSCEDPDACLVVRRVNLTADNPVVGSGFLVRVTDILQTAALDVANDRPLSQEAIQLIQAAPFPLYQAVNAAATYPAAASNLLETMGVLTAELMVYSYFNETINSGVGTRQASTTFDAEQMRKIAQLMEAFALHTKENRTVIAQNIALQEGLYEQVRRINLAIQREVMSQELLGNQKYATTVTAPQNP